MILIYIPKITQRHKYIFNLFFCEIYKIKFQLTENVDEFKAFDGAKLNYSNNCFEDEIFIESIGLLNEKGINQQEISVILENDIPIFFQSQSKASMPFDVFSASFYLVSRYEEYLPFVKDKYQRFQAESSLAYKNDFLQKPMVNIWTKTLIEEIKQKYPSLKIVHPTYNYISTIDIDNAFYYLEKGFVRSIAGLFRSLFSVDFKAIKERTAVLFGKEKDPYDTYAAQLKLQKEYDLEVIYFILLADYGLNDKNISFTKRKFQLLIKHLADYAQIGIHPSYGSNTNFEKLPKEIKRLEGITKREVTKSRQHFLKLTLPETYNQLADLGITDDYTMGFASAIGFRASICSSFTFYNLDTETILPIKIHPFAVMDATLLYYLNLSPEQSIKQINQLIEQVKNVNGTFISLWHNDTFSNYKQWEGWQSVYKEMVKVAK
ncbi:MAG: polysaccharide deacetylase family protein [Flavobacteriales bacterium]|nr:polysaccharide deacetylase family protein [Flavobacteriales bacterium]